MTERTRKRIVYLIFVAALIFGALNLLGPRRSSPGSGSTDTEIATIQPLVTGSMKNSPVADNSEWGRDPFVRAGQVSRAVVQQETFRLSAISGSTEQPLALIDGRAVGVGDSVKGWSVVKISRRSVQLERNGESKTLTIGGS